MLAKIYEYEDAGKGMLEVDHEVEEKCGMVDEAAKMVTEVAKEAEEAANELKKARESHRKVAKAFVWRGCPPSGAAAHPGVPSAGHGSGSDLAPSGPSEVGSVLQSTVVRSRRGPIGCGGDLRRLHLEHRGRVTLRLVRRVGPRLRRCICSTALRLLCRQYT